MPETTRATPESPVSTTSLSREANEATRGSALKLGAEVLGRLLYGLTTTVAIPRVLGVEGTGTFGALSAVALVAAEAADLGLQGTASQALVAGTDSLRAMVRAKLLISGGVLVLSLLALPWAPVFAPLLIFFTLAGWSEFLGLALRARGRPVLETLVIFCLRASGLASIGLVILLGPTLPRVAWGAAVSPLPPILLGIFLLRGTRPTHPQPAPDRPVALILRSALPLAVNGGLALLSLRIELLAIKVVRGAHEAGLFTVALRVIEFLNGASSAICAGAMPALTREALRGEGPVRRRTGFTAALIAAPAALGLLLVAPEVIVVLGGPAFAGGASALRVMALSLLPLFLNAVLLHSLIAVGRASTLPRLTLVRVTSATLLALALVPRFGAVGGAVGFLVSELILLALAARACAGARFPVPLLQPSLVGLAAAAPMAALVALSGAGLVLSIALGLAAYAVTLAVAWRFTPGLAS
jgi:O-antigen/teichoic acid export membrane protein